MFEGTPRFGILRRLGAGGMGVVYEALDRERGVPVALKTLRTRDADALLRFKNEFRLAQDVAHPNLVRLGELFEHEGEWFFTMELVDGVSFLEHVRPGLSSTQPPRLDLPSTGAVGAGAPPSVRPATLDAARAPLHVERLRDALAQLAKGLAALHDARKVHRDIKPSNVLVTRDADARVVVLDFGVLTDAASRDPWEQDEELVGTFAYMAPEQARAETVGPEADWYAVGVMLYQALTGRLPLAGNGVELLTRKQLTAPVPPSAHGRVPEDLDRLCVDLLAIEPGQRPTGREVLRRLRVASDSLAPRAGGAEDTPFVGRAGELEALRAALADARDGAVVVCVHGESGVGKSALVAAFAETARAEADALVLRARCHERESVPYKALDGVIDAASRWLATRGDDEIASLVPEDAALLADAFPVARGVGAIARARAIDAALEPRTRRARLFDAVRGLLERIASTRRVVIAIDDLQWADDDGLAMLAAVVEPPRAPRVLVVATLREAGDRRVDVVAKRLPGDVRVMPLAGLSPEDARALAAALLGGRDDSVAARLAREAKGHPLFLDELARRTRARDGDGPVRLEDAIAARVAKLDARSRALLEGIAVAAAPIAQATLAEASGIDPREALDAIASLRGAKLARTSGPRASDAVEAWHDRVRAAVHARVPADARRAWHGRLARALEAHGARDVDALYAHWRGAGEDARAAEYARRAADDAARALAFDRAASLYRACLDLAGVDDAPIRARLGDALANAGRGVEAAEAYARAADSSEADVALDLRRRAADQLLCTGHVDAGIAQTRAVLEAVGARWPESSRAALASLLVARAIVRVRGTSFRARPEADLAPRDRTRVDTYWSAATGLAIVDTIRAADLQSRGLLLALRAGEPFRVARALAAEAAFSAANGPGARARTASLLAQAEGLAGDRAVPELAGHVRACAGLAAYLESRWRDAHATLDAASATLRGCAGVAWELHTTQLYAMIALVYAGELAEVGRRLPVHLRDAVDRGNLCAATTLRTLLNVAWLAEGEPERARAELVVAKRDWTRHGFHLQHYWTLFAEGQLDLHAGRADVVHRAIEERWGALESSLLLRIDVVRLEALHLRARAAIAAAAITPGDAPRLLADADRVARTLARSHSGAWRAMGALVRAGVASSRGDDAAACDALDAAVTGFDAAGMGAYAAAARLRLAALRGGDEGAATGARGRAWLEAQGVRMPERFVATLAPGFAG